MREKSSKEKRRAEQDRKANAWRGLQVVKKTFNGITVGFVIGWWKCKSRWNSDRGQTFQSYRQGVIYPDEASARAQRDIIEAARIGTRGVEWESVPEK